MGPLEILIANEQSRAVEIERLRAGAARVFADAGVSHGEVSIAIVDDPTIHELNRRFLAHDYPTDVISFVFDRTANTLHGEIIVSADTAAASCGEYGWPEGDELLLYVVHGALHLVGYDDKSPEKEAAMRQAERETFARLGIAMGPPEGM